MKPNKRVSKAVKDALKSNLIKVDNDDIKFGKSQSGGQHQLVQKILHTYELGDFVFYDKELGYNNRIGDKVAICVNDDIDNMLFMVLDHYLQNNKTQFASMSSELLHHSVKKYEHGYESTKYVKDNYPSSIRLNTIWTYLKDNEYIPTIDELEIITNNYKKYKELNSKIDIESGDYWSCTQFTDVLPRHLPDPEMVYIVMVQDGSYPNYTQKDRKDHSNHSIVLLNINNK